MEESELFEGLKVNVLDDGLQVVEPDVLVDISAIAACFQDYGHHPLAYLINRLKPSANTSPILLGNFAGTALDQIIHDPEADFGDMLRASFSEQALQFCTCEDFNPVKFKTDALRQVNNIRQAVDALFTEYDRNKALLEPSFVCKALGLRGRVDLMTSDMRLLVEQKSGKKWGSYREAHFVQVLLYYGVLRYNFQLDTDSVDIRLLYSKYPVSEGLLDVANNDALFREAIHLRNLIVAMEMKIARKGFSSVLSQLQPDVLLQRQEKSDFFHRYVRPEIERTLQPLHSLSATEQDYLERMVTFIFREQFAQLLTQDTDEELRRGDMVYYYRKDGDPDLCHHILNKGMIERIDDEEIAVWPNDNRQDTPDILRKESYAIEPATSDATTTAALRSLIAFCGASPQKRHLLMGNLAPRQDTSQRLSRSYHPAYDDILLRAKQARDYFLLQGPPGTGKTSMALRFLVEEELSSHPSPLTPHLLLTAYTHRAVDEICTMLEESGQDYLRLGSEAACDPRFAHRLLSSAFSEKPKLSDIRQRLERVPIVVSTTLTLLTRPFLLSMKHFSLCIVDEASQILEPYIVGLLSSDSIDRFILIGDHKQLPAVVAQPDDDPRLHSCRLSLFERLLRQEREAGRKEFVGILQRQGRMHPDIAAFPNEFFYQQEQLQPVPCPHQLETGLDYLEPSEDALDEQLKQHRVLFLPADDEASLVVDVLQRLYRQIGHERFDAAHSIGVIVTYRHQIAMIRREMARLGLSQLEEISIDTVERYQGSQRDVIIYSTGVQNHDGLDFLTANCFVEDGHTVDRKLNVALTRARKQLILTGNRALLKQNKIFSAFIARYSI
ncbi:MAG: DNA2/NAM7 family helicase [Prevotella sp.]|nr:DNA2/NAM7 family helicase [Prevotella sp.]